MFDKSYNFKPFTIPKNYEVMKPCACDCGEEIHSVSLYNKPQTYKLGHHRRNKTRELSKRWKGGRIKSVDGYIRKYAPNHPRSYDKYIAEHILIMEEKLGRYLESGEIVHHINGIKDDNRTENLELLTDSEHKRLHVIRTNRARKNVL